jgi:hypothetical protein
VKEKKFYKTFYNLTQPVRLHFMPSPKFSWLKNEFRKFDKGLNGFCSFY